MTGTSSINYLLAEGLLSGSAGSAGPAWRRDWDERFCARLASVAAGRAAAGIVAGLPSRPRAAVVLCLPAWHWTPPATNVGRKAAGPGGQVRALPVRMTWEAGPVVLLEAGRHQLSWSAEGLGHRLAGAYEAKVVPHPRPERSTSASAEIGPPVPGRELRSQLEAIAETGELAWWALREMIEPAITKALRIANASVSSELWPGGGTVLSSLDLEVIATDMLHGDRKAPGSFARLVERCLRPRAFLAVDPSRYVAVSLRRDAKEAVHRRIGDPRIGPKIRRLAAESDYGSSPTEITRLIEHYRVCYPSDHLALQRAQAALDIATYPPTTPISIDQAEDGRAGWLAAR